MEDALPLTDTAIRNAKPGEKPYKLADEKGLLYPLLTVAARFVVRCRTRIQVDRALDMLNCRDVRPPPLRRVK